MLRCTCFFRLKTASTDTTQQTPPKPPVENKNIYQYRLQHTSRPKMDAPLLARTQRYPFDGQYKSIST